MAGTQQPTYQLYRYTPSLAAAVVFIIVFSLLTIAHFFRLFQRRTWFCVPFAIGGLCKSSITSPALPFTTINKLTPNPTVEAIGYIGRALSHSNPQSLNPYIIQSLLILVAPALFAASIYMALGRLVRALHAQHHSFIRSTWTTKIFVVGDVLSFFIQGGGGGIMATASSSNNPQKTFDMGQYVILGGLFMQILMFGLFVAVAVVFHLRLRKAPTAVSVGGRLSWEKIMFMLEGVSCLILVRNIVRVAEYIQGRDGYLLGVEWSTYIFDACLMAATMGLFLWQYPDVGMRERKNASVESLSGSEEQRTGWVEMK